MTTKMTKRAFAREILNEWDHNEFEGGDDIGTLVDAKYAVIVERDDDSWVRAATSAEDVAGIALSCYTGTEGYDEWINSIWDLEKQEQVKYTEETTVKVTIGDDVGEASTF